MRIRSYSAPSLFASLVMERFSIRNTMKLVILFSGTLCFLSGCVSIKAPDNLVSDTVDASKNIYRSVKGKLSEDDVIGSEGVFYYTYEIPDEEPFGVSNTNCINAAIEETKKSLNKYSVTIQKTESQVSVVGSKSILICSVSI